MLRLDRVSRTFGGKKAVDELSFTVDAGSVVGLLGPNGAGKSTTLKMIAGLVTPDSGEVTIDGVPVARMRESIAFVPDEPVMWKRLTGREYLLFAGRLRGIPHEGLQERIAFCSKLFEMDGWLDQRTGSYSHGMIQRVVLSSAFTARPRLYVIDEPLVGLDPPSAETFWRMVRAAADSGAGVLISTHTLSEVHGNCDTLCIIHQGRIIRSMESAGVTLPELRDLFFSVTGTAPGDVTSYFER
ncbi:MAG: ABC transporter ATP-binding protein [Candidatus Fermentibacteraceae bacterium]